MERYYALDSKFEFREYDTATRVIESNDWLLIMITNFKSEQEFNCDDFNFISKGEKTISKEIKINGWAGYIVNVLDNKDKWKYRPEFRIVAPDGRIRNLTSDYYVRGFKSIIESIKKLDKIGQFSNWEQYDVFLENSQLKFKIESLEKQIIEFKNQIEELKKNN